MGSTAVRPAPELNAPIAAPSSPPTKRAICDAIWYARGR
jgi:hypothetical protein